jgi:hypothetical protein
MCSKQMHECMHAKLFVSLKINVVANNYFLTLLKPFVKKKQSFVFFLELKLLSLHIHQIVQNTDVTTQLLLSHLPNLKKSPLDFVGILDGVQPSNGVDHQSWVPIFF